MKQAERPQPVHPLRPRVLPPGLAPTIIERRALLARIDARRPAAVTSIVAPSGYGKSALVAGWLRTWDGVSAWLSLDRADDSAEDVARAIVAACQREAPGIGRVALAMLASATSPEAIGAAIAGELTAAGRPFALVLDDAQELTSDGAWAVLRGLIAQAGPDLHVALTSWTTPRLDRGALLASGRLVEIFAADLAFRPEEIVAVAERTGRTLDPARLDRIVALSAGWPVIVRVLLADDLGDRPIDSVLGDPSAAEAVAEYVRRLTAAQPASVVEALEWATLIDPVSDDLLRVVLGPGGAGGDEPPLATLGDVVLLSISGSEEGWYRLQPIVREDLERRLRARVRPAEVRAARLRAAAWYADHGLTTEAIRQAMAAGDPDVAVAIVVRAGYDRLRWQVTGEIGRWLTMLPADLVAERADLLVLRAFDAGRGFASVASGAAAREARRLLETGAGGAPVLEPPARLLPLTHVIELDASAGPATAEALLSFYRQLLPTIAPEDQLARGLLTTTTALRLSALEGVEAGQTLLEERRGGIGADDLAEQAYSAAGLALLQDFTVESGDRLRTTLEQARRLAAMHDIIGLQSFAATRLGWEALRLLDIEAADALLAESAALPEISGLVTWREERQGAAMVRMVAGDEAAAHAIAANIVATIEGAGLHALLENARSFQVRLWLISRDFPRIDAWLAQAVIDPQGEQPTFPEITLLTYVRAMLSLRQAMVHGDAVDAAIEHALEMLEQTARGTRQERGLLAALVGRGLFASARGLDPTEFLEAAVRLAAKRDDVLIFAENGQPMAEMLELSRTALPEPTFVARAIAAATRIDALFPHRPTNRRLTDRELDVLVALTSRLERREIAERLHISDRTVQRHTVTLYRKLGVGNRAEAVRRGVEFGWLPPS